MTNQAYSRIFDEKCVEWSKDERYNLMFLKTQENYFNDVLKTRGHLFLNEVYEGLSIPKTPEGQLVGWLSNNKDSLVDFGTQISDKKIFLNFNVQGVIYDKI